MMLSKAPFRASFAVAAAVIAAGLSGCGGSNANQQGPEARVRLVHALPGVGAVDATAGGRRVAQELAFGNVSRNTVVRAELQPVLVRLAGTTTDVLPRSNIQPEALLRHTLMLYGTSAAPRLAFYADDSATPPRDQARLRFFHGNANATDARYDVFIEPEGTVADGPALRNLGYGSASLPWNLVAGTVNIRIVAAGTTTPVLGELRGVSLAARRIVTYAIVTSPTDNLQAVRVNDN